MAFETRSVCHAFVAAPRAPPTFVMPAPRGYHPAQGTCCRPVSDPPLLTAMDAARTSYDVIIVGAGPAGIFAALELVRRDGLDVLLVERGPDIARRSCPARTTGVCSGCEPCDITCGWGGAGAFSDGKLTLTPDVGGWLDRFVSRQRLTELIEYVDGIWLEYGATPEVHGGGKQADRIRRAGPAARHDAGRVAGAPHGDRAVLREPHAHASRSCRSASPCAPAPGSTASSRRSPPARASCAPPAWCSRTARASTPAPSSWRRAARAPAGSSDECRRLHIKLRTNPVDIGVRVEVAAAIMEPLTTALYESKLIYYTPSFDDPVRTFCMNPYGEVSLENYGDVVTVNGHSYADMKTDRTNFALLVSTDFTEPFDDPLAYGKSIARLANLLGEDIIVQRLGDLHAGPPQHHGPHRARHRAAVAEGRHGRRPRLRAAVPPPARHPRDARGHGQAGAGRERPRHAAVRRRGEVLLGAARDGREPADAGARTCTPSATGPASRAGWCRLPRPA